MAEESTTPDAPIGRPVDPRAGTTYPGRKLDKTLSTIPGPMPKGPEKTPGGFGHVWRDK